MNNPSLDQLLKKVDSKYTLIIAGAKRARQITLENPELSRSGEVNPVSKALQEIHEGKVVWHRTKDGIK